ncbi:MAG TPA: rod shape-determining protein MreC [Terracidiphilus sp.]|jgi:rod shape-determining protein MreC
MESFFVRYRNLLVLMVLLISQIIGLAVQVRRTAAGRNVYDQADGQGVRLIRLWANAMVSPPERAVESSKTGAGSIWQNYFALQHVRQENKDLQATVDRLRLEQAQLLEDARQGHRLQGLLSFQEKYLYKTLPAQVIGTSGSDQSQVFTIDKGEEEGMKRDMAVISADGIVGKVREVFRHTAQVLAINDQSSGAGVILQETRIRGILRGNAQGQPQIVGILADNRIKPGEKVLTAGGDQIFPRGLPVGVVQKVATDPDRDGFIRVIVSPAAHLDQLDEVLVITDSQPRFSAQQMKDMADSQDLKGPDAAALEEQRKASEIMAERLPGLTDPNAPPTPPANAQQQPGANGLPAPPAAAVVPKIVAPAHPDRFTPGNAPSPQSGTAADQAAPKPKKPAAPKPATSASGQQRGPAENKPAPPKPQNSQPQRER